MIRIISQGIGILLFVSFLISLWAVKFISDGYVGVLIRKGAAQGVLESGIHVINPFIDSVLNINIRNQRIEVKSSSVTSDLHTVNITAIVAFRVPPEYADKLCEYSSYVNSLIIPSAQESTNIVVSQFKAEQLMVSREELNGLIIDNLMQKLSVHGIVIEDLNITSLEMG